MSIIMNEMKYTRDHEWVKVEGNMATIGIADYVRRDLGDIVDVELHDVGRVFKAGDTFAVIESDKAASDCYMPISGKVTETNEAIEDNPSLLNRHPYTNWMIKIEVVNPADLHALMDAAAYNVYLRGEQFYTEHLQKCG